MHRAVLGDGGAGNRSDRADLRAEEDCRSAMSNTQNVRTATNIVEEEGVYGESSQS